MARGGARANAGRKQGSLSRKTREIAEAAAEEGITPLEFLVSVMRDPQQGLSVRLDAAKSAAPYMHPRLQTIAHTGEDGGPLTIVVETGIARAD